MSTTFYFTSGFASGILSGPSASFNLDVKWSGATTYAGSGLSMLTSGFSFLSGGAPASGGSPASGTAVSGTSLAGRSGIPQTHFIQQFVSPPLGGQPIYSGNVYTVNFTASESGTAGNFLTSGLTAGFLTASIYLFRSGSISVLASGHLSGINFSSGSLVSGTLVSGTIVGTSGTANSGDVMVLELYWLSGVQNQSGSVNLAVQFGSGTYS